MPKAYVDQDECIGCESCVEICPEAFHMTDEAKAEVLPRRIRRRGVHPGGHGYLPGGVHPLGGLMALSLQNGA